MILDSKSQKVRGIDEVSLDPGPATVSHRETSDLTYTTTFTVPPGTYTLKLVAQNAAHEHTATYSNQFTVPD